MLLWIGYHLIKVKFKSKVWLTDLSDCFVLLDAHYSLMCLISMEKFKNSQSQSNDSAPFSPGRPLVENTVKSLSNIFIGT